MNRKIRQAIITLLEANIGFGIDFVVQLSVSELEDGRFRIFDGDPDDPTTEEHIFNNASEAADKFLSLREKRQLGFDFERKNMKRWTENENGPKCFCGAPTVVKIVNDKPKLLCIVHTKEEGALWNLPSERPKNWPNLSTKEMQALIKKGIAEFEDDD